MTNKTLSIVLPTFERVEALKKSLPPLIEQAKLYDVAIYISDDSRTNGVKILVENFQQLYPNIFYIQNIERLGHDRNYLKALLYGTAEYIWILGDRTMIKNGSLKKIINVLDIQRPKILSMNKEGRNLNLDQVEFKSCDQILETLGWHLTYTGATIYSTEVITFLKENKLGVSKNFPQIWLIFHYLSVNCSFFWINEKLIDGVKVGASYWKHRVFEVFIDDWENAIKKLPETYSNSIKQKVILQHAKKTALFDLGFFLLLRKDGYFSWSQFKKYYFKLRRHSSVNFLTIMIILIVPKQFLRFFYFFYKKLKS